jgi:hypothetical protein
MSMVTFWVGLNAPSCPSLPLFTWAEQGSTRKAHVRARAGRKGVFIAIGGDSDFQLIEHKWLAEATSKVKKEAILGKSFPDQE